MSWFSGDYLGSMGMEGRQDTKTPISLIPDLKKKELTISDTIKFAPSLPNAQSAEVSGLRPHWADNAIAGPVIGR